MRRARTIAIIAGLAIVVAALVGWRGSRPTSPIIATRSDGVTVVPATGTLPRQEAASAVPPKSVPAPAAIAGATSSPIGLGLDTAAVERLSDRVAAETRDPAWAPAAEARLRAAFADVPHLGPAPRITCAATLCEMEGSLPVGLSPSESEAALAALQGPAIARTRADFADNAARIVQPDDAPVRFTVWFARR